MRFPNLESEVMELVAVIHSDNHLGRYYTDWIDMMNRHKLFAIMTVGDMGQAATVDLELQEAIDAAGTGAQAIAAKAITQLTQAGGDGDDAVCIDLRAEEMTAANRYRFVRARLDVLQAATHAALFLFVTYDSYPPVGVTLWTEVVP